MTTFSEKQNGVWSTPIYLDSIQRGGLPPSLCVDRWNGVHVFFGDDDGNGHNFGLREKVKDRWRWSEGPRVDTIAGDVEPVADGDRLHLLVSKEWNGNLGDRQVWYTYRDMDPPAIQEAEQPLPASEPPALSPVTKLAEIPFVLDRPGKVEIAIMDCSGRRIWISDNQVLTPGQHSFFPCSHLPGSGVFYCRIKAGNTNKVVKLVRVN